ncbi:ABC transporter [Vibrio sp. JCM 19236]|nr:ABC transporter [Vibrio sp. JCM 19236]
MIALPMLIPQLSMLFGLQVITLFVEGNYHWLWVCWSHVLFAFPFVYLALDGPWRSYNPRMTQVALSLGKSPLHVFLHVKLPQLLSAVLFAWAIGISVSLTQYLPTLILGAGRITTLTTEAVALSSGFDRRVTAIYALWQALLPLVFFTLAVLLSRIKLRRISVKGFDANESVSKRPQLYKRADARHKDRTSLFKNVEILVEPGEVVSLMGPSGCGKSTLLDVIAGHLNDEFTYDGEVTLNGVDIHHLPAHKREVGILFQDDLLFPHLNVWENLAFALPESVKGAERKKQALAALQNISLLELKESYPEQISGGQRARIALAVCC